MKREDFKNITEEHKKICEEVVNGKTNCGDINCLECMFHSINTYGNGCNTYYDSQTYISKNYIDKIFVASCKLFLKTFFNDELNIEKEDVITIESQEVFDSVAFRIVYQNEEVLKRGEFKDVELDVYSSTELEYTNGNLYIRGNVKKYDNKKIIVSKEEFKDIENRVRMINEKYGIKKEWRAEKNGVYFYINVDFLVIKMQEYYYDGDDILYKAHNYFKTREEAEKVAEKFRKILEER